MFLYNLIRQTCFLTYKTPFSENGLISLEGMNRFANARKKR